MSSNDDPASQHPAAAIEAADGPADESEFEPVNWDASSVDSVSLSSSVYAHEYENGRRYHSYRHGRYPMPNDETEQSREDMKHTMLLELTDGKLIYAPIGETPQRIIDIGTGTGTWAIQVADLFPAAEVLGIDLSPIQPTWIPPNVKFLVDDAEDEWLNGDDFDYVHLRSVAPALRKLDRVLTQAYEHMKPGAWIEFQELHGQVHCDDGTMPEDDKLEEFYELTVEAFAGLGIMFHIARDLRPHLEAAGFKDIHCEVKKIPVGTWPKDKTMRLIGQYMKGVVADAIPAFAGKPFEAHGISNVESQVWQATAKKELEDRTKHRYLNFYFWYAQKPEDAPEHDAGAGSSGEDDT
ncbi:methyltransferase domain-containing protein [Colletotrichum abscissum]|uniref:methyltransferase domain-containing protein n=1 Tax=Colletotrichum abscissum TaxID=1671311 RepID=UPI0027D48DEC|nr:methyltransferase domain-containing protein [Colletotrichum abscissum]KAK1510259.1 methyltransferase domain-containing protein [Colletotrichum abscissum]